MIPIHDDNPTRIKPVVTVSLMAFCSLVFFWQLSLGPAAKQVIDSLGLIPAVLFDLKELPSKTALIPPWATVVTSMFLHGGWMHLIGNLLYLWIFGNNVEDAMGHGRFVLFYLACGFAAALSQALPHPDSLVPMIGASGAISGILGAYLLLYPHARVLVIIPLGFIFYTVRLRAGWVLVFWFAMQVLSSAVSSNLEGGVAWGAHIGGFLAGMILIPIFKHKKARLFAPGRRF